MVVVKWSKYGTWSGPNIKGTQPYVPPTKPTEWDVIAYATAYPEGGNYDAVAMCDGTAVTWGLYQWTATSTRLQNLLATISTQASAAYLKTVGTLFDDLGLVLKTTPPALWYKAGKVLGTTALRKVFTPPNGKCPSSGDAWKTAKEIALAFWQLGQDKAVQQIQTDFFRDELQSESLLKRPKLGGKTIASVLYAGSDVIHEGMGAPTIKTAARALFFSCWQNSPRQAEAHLQAIAGSFSTAPADFTIKFARKIAYSQFGNWGIEKAKANKREARYTKIAKCVNKLMGAGTLPLNP